mmetsp:Transcript_5239/g.10022  ORF Transcript_5239/g.10022 Transcript_5239/m.10022 type:complete len:162 (+) Transcript_5239:3-488(+)
MAEHVMNHVTSFQDRMAEVEASAEGLRSAFEKVFSDAAGISELTFKRGETIDLQGLRTQRRLFLVLEGSIVAKVGGWSILWAESGDTFGEFGYLVPDEFPWDSLEVKAGLGQPLRVMTVPYLTIRSTLLRDKALAAKFLQFAAKRVALMLNSWLSILQTES